MPARHSTTAVVGSAVVAVLCAAFPAAGQGPDTVRTAFPDSFRLEEGVMVSVTRALTQTGGSSAVEVDLVSMNLIPAATLENVLARLPLVQIRTNSRGEAQPALRGADDRQIAVLVDGIPLTLGWDHRTDLSIIPLTAARSITLLRGASSVLYGPNVLGGVVEVDVVRGNRRMTAPRPATVSFGVDHTGAVSAAASAGALNEVGSGQWLLTGGAGFRDRSGVPLPDLGAVSAEENVRLADPDDSDLRLNSDLRHFDAFAAARYLSDGGAWVSVIGSGFETERGVPPETHELEPRLWRYANQNRFVAAVSGGTGQRETGAGSGDLEASIGIDVGSFAIESFESLEFESVAEMEEGDSRTLTARLLGDHTIGTLGDLRTAFTYGDVSHEETLAPGGINDYRQRLWSFAAETEWRLDEVFDTDDLRGMRLNVGAVVDGADTPESGDKPPLERLWDWGTHVGVSSVHAGGNLLLHGGLSRRVRFPSLRELYSGALGRFLPNPELRPETQWSGELGLTWNRRPIEFQLVGFRQELQDGIVRIGVDTEDGPLRQRVNQDRVRSTGIELLLSGTAGPVAFSGDVTYQKTWRFDEMDVRFRPEYEPDWTGKLDLAVPLIGGAQGNFEVYYRSSQYCLSTENGGMDRLDPNDWFDVEVRRVFRRSTERRQRFANVDASVVLSNATDAAVFDQCGLPQPGRTLRFQVRLY